MVKVASALGYDKKSQAYKTAKGMFASAGFSEKDIDMIDTAPGDEEVPVAKPNAYGKDKGTTLGAGDYELDIEKDKKSQPKKSKPGQQYLSKTGTQEMESKDGSSFEGYKSGKLKAPGTPAGAFAEVGGLKIAGYLREHPNATDEELTKYISNWAKTGKVTKQPKVSGGDKLTAAVHTGRAIFEKINQVASEEGYDPKTTTAEGYWGDKESLIHAQQRVDEIAKKNPKATFNGYSAEEYKKIIAANGAGENPTDSMVIIWDGKSNNVSLLHVSNKIGSNNIQANSTVRKTYDRAVSIINNVFTDEVQKQAAMKSVEKRKGNTLKTQ
jgi:RNA binding exosome subunit